MGWNNEKSSRCGLPIAGMVHGKLPLPKRKRIGNMNLVDLGLFAPARSVTGLNMMRSKEQLDGKIGSGRRHAH